MSFTVTVNVGKNTRDVEKERALFGNGMAAPHQRRFKFITSGAPIVLTVKKKDTLKSLEDQIRAQLTSGKDYFTIMDLKAAEGTTFSPNISDPKQKLKATGLKDGSILNLHPGWSQMGD